MTKETPQPSSTQVIAAIKAEINMKFDDETRATREAVLEQARTNPTKLTDEELVLVDHADDDDF